MTAISLDGVEKHFGPSARVGPVSFAVQPGEFMALLGPSGCGKTTTLRMIAGFEEPSAGTVSIAGRVVNDVPVERRGVAMVFQSYALFPHLSVAENVAFGLRLRRVPADERMARVGEALAMVGLADLAQRMPRQLSGGQQQRVSLARALVVRPAVLLLDEPLSNLDLKLREQMRDEIRTLQRRLAITAVYVTHDQGEAMAIADRIAVMNRGRIEQLDTPRVIYEQPASLFVAGFIGQCSVLSGRFDGMHGGNARFVSRSGLGFDAAARSVAWPTGQAVSLAIRPESVSITPLDGPANRFDAAVAEMVYLGDHATLTLRIGDGSETIAAVAPVRRGAALPAPGDRVAIAIRPEDCVMIVGDAS
ncbi:MAG: ABC transporter ATP-binding protein [Alphaproteobacteria bacterium]|nr:ABC transporter ATP-binding protein [Alphaproteobacteria bacterium]